MPIDPAAIERFLTRALPEVPRFKGAAPDALHRLIYNSTGLPHKEHTKLRPLQLEGLAFALYKRRSLLLFWMRTGKTLIALDWALHLKRANLASGKGLVIAHAPIGAEVWATQAARHSSLDLRVIQSGPDARDEFVDALESNCDLVVAPHSTLQTLFSEKRLNRKKEPKLYPDLEGLALAADFFSHCVIDEIHLCSNPTSLRLSIAENLIAKCKHRLGLTGTPVGRNPFAIWAQAYLVDEGAMFSNNYFFFEAAFGKSRRNPFARGGKEIVFDKDKLPAFQAKLANMSVAYGKDEINSAEIYAGVVELRMSPPQREAYNDVVEKLIKVGSNTIEIQSTFHRLRQVASGYLPFNDEDGSGQIIHFDNSIKLAWLREFVEDLDKETQCIIFHEYVHTGELICKLLKEMKREHVWLYGQVESHKRAPILNAFAKGDAQFFVANSEAGGTAIDLPQADYLCFFESPVSPIKREQAAARPMARGQRPLMLDDLVCAPVERKILGFLAEGRDLYEALLRGGRKVAESLRD